MYRQKLPQGLPTGVVHVKKGGARKKVRFLSEIMTRGQADGNDNGTAAQEVPVLPPIGNVQNVNASQVVPSVHGDVAAESGQIQFPPVFGTGRRLTIAEKGKTPVVHEDPIIEAVRRAINGGGPVIRDGEHQANDQARDVMGFDDKMRRCSGVDKLRKWYCHTHPYTVQLTGAMIEAVFDREGDPEVDHMIAMWRLLKKEEAKLFRGPAERFRVIPDFRLGEELMEAERSSDPDFDYIVLFSYHCCNVVEVTCVLAGEDAGEQGYSATLHEGRR